MSKTVFILGAGTSKQVGAPVMAEFLDYAENILASGRADSDKLAFENVFRGIQSLQAVYTKSYIDSRNLEAVFTAFEMAGILCNLPGYSTPQSCRELLRDLRKVIVRTLELNTLMANQNDDPKAPLRDFVDYLKANHFDELRRSSIITFNYDCALDYAIHRRQLQVDYGLEAASQLNAPVELLKLHGSLNWATKQTDEASTTQQRIVVLRPSQFSLYHHRDTPDDRYATIAHQTMSGFEIPAEVYEPVIVPPTWAKPGYYDQLAAVWKRAALHLSEAENIIVIGYSLPATDEFFRNLFALGTIGAARLRRVWVFDKYPSVELDRRYRCPAPIRDSTPTYRLHDW